MTGFSDTLRRLGIFLDPPGLPEFHSEVYGGDVATNGNPETTRERSELTCARPEQVHHRARKDGISAVAMRLYDPAHSACGNVSGPQVLAVIVTAFMNSTIDYVLVYLRILYLITSRCQGSKRNLLQ